MKSFFGICVDIDILKLPEIHLYWQRQYSLFEIADWNQHMNCDRFIAVLRYLKFCDEEVESQPQQVAPDQPPAQHENLRHFLDQILPRYAAEWTDNQWLAIYEQTGAHQMELPSPIQALGINPFPSRFINRTVP